MFVFENAFDSIIFKFEFGSKLTFVRFLQYSKVIPEMILIFDGIEISFMLRAANTRTSNSSLLLSLFPNKYLLSLNMILLFNGETIIFVKFIEQMKIMLFISIIFDGI